MARRIAVVTILISFILLFSRIATSTILLSGIGFTLLIIGIIYGYRPSSIMGMLVVAIVAGAFVEMDTITELRMALTAFGICLIILILAWIALTCESEERMTRIQFFNRGGIFTVVFIIFCAFSVPIAMLVSSLILPTFSSQTSEFSEIVIILMVAVVGFLTMTYHRNRSNSNMGSVSRE